MWIEGEGLGGAQGTLVTLEWWLPQNFFKGKEVVGTTFAELFYFSGKSGIANFLDSRNGGNGLLL